VDFLAERQAAEAELTAVVGLDDQRLFQLAKLSPPELKTTLKLYCPEATSNWFS